jgi:solute carrier family 41
MYGFIVVLDMLTTSFFRLDNIACPMASSLGDVVTLVILAGCSHALLASLGK